MGVIKMTENKNDKKSDKRKRHVQFIKSAVLAKDYPPATKPEIAFMGRSNAGKSSLINNISRQKIAKVSQTPGKTRLLNFFDFDKYVLVDMPGYGYASRSGDEIAEWQTMIEGYLTERENLAGLVLVIDIRRKWTKEEHILVQFVQGYGRPVVVALTKTDKLKKLEIKKYIEQHKKSSKLNAIFAISNTDKHGYDEMEEYIYQEWIKNFDQSGYGQFDDEESDEGDNGEGSL